MHSKAQDTEGICHTYMCGKCQICTVRIVLLQIHLVFHQIMILYHSQ